MMIKAAYFPTIIYAKDVNLDNRLFEREVLAWADRDKGVKRTNMKGWHSQTNMHEIPVLNPFCIKLNDTDILISLLSLGSTQCHNHDGNITILPSIGFTRTSLHKCDGGSPSFLVGITICAPDLGSLNTICPEFLGAWI